MEGDGRRLFAHRLRSWWRMEEVQLCAGHVLVFLVHQILIVRHDFNDC